jgi:NADPH2:quinone reductase
MRSTERMHAVVCRGFDGIGALTLGELPRPRPGAGQVMVEVRAAAVSFMDTLIVAGRYQMRPQLPFVPGSDAAGIVLAVGDGVDGVQPGDRVACSHWHGAMAECMVVSARAVTPLPPELSFEVGATVRYAYGTAHYALAGAQVRPGETVFVSGAAGGVGLAAVELASRMGATVIAGTSSHAKGELARRQGAAHVIDYTREPLRARLQELTEGRGVDVAFDTVGGAVFDAVSRTMAWGGRLLPIGFTGGEIPSLAMNLPLMKNYSVVGCYWGAWVEKFPDESRLAHQRLVDAVGRGELRPQVTEVLPLASFAEGFRRVAEREVTGRIVLRLPGGG